MLPAFPMAMHVPKSIEDPVRAFLRLHRADRLTDYLDPIGEPALAALARRLGWAAEHVDDPVHGDEALFLLQNAGLLHDMLTKEIAQLDEEMEATLVGDVDDLEDSPATEEVPREASPYREQYDLHFGGIMQLDDVTDPPTQPRSEVPAYTPDAPQPRTEQQRSPAPTRPSIDTTTPVTARIPGLGTPAPVRRAPPPPTPPPVAPAETGPQFDALRKGIRRRATAPPAPVPQVPDTLWYQRYGSARSPLWALGIGIGIAVAIVIAFFTLW
ncbi:MAG: hypothetical protein ACI8PZ_001937 [Myxococcota bacterium]